MSTPTQWRTQLRAMPLMQTTTILQMQHFQIIQLYILEEAQGRTPKALEDSIHMEITNSQRVSMVKMLSQRLQAKISCTQWELPMALARDIILTLTALS